MGLIGDLFPTLDVPRKRNAEFEKLVKTSSMQLSLQPDDSFVLKVNICYYNIKKVYNRDFFRSYN